MADPQDNRELTPEEARRRKQARLKRQKERKRKKIIRFCIAWGSVALVVILVTVLVVSCAVNAGKKNADPVKESETVTTEAVLETTPETTAEETTTEAAKTGWDGVTAEEMIANGQATKIVFLTFDDGPGPYTEELLDILAKYDVKATFFVTNNFIEYNNMITREFRDGHSVAVHTYTHDYETVYTSEEAYWDDFNAMNDVVEELTGHRSDFFRFPGGASNEVSWQYNEGIMTRLTQQAIERGLDYVDWDVSSGDGGSTDDTEEIISRVINGIEEYDVSVVLMHDTHDYSVNAVEDIILYCRENGYTLLPFYKGIYECHHGVNN